MKPVYDIKFLSNEDFDNMPILDRLGEDVSESMGIYNPHTGQIRIRDTGFWEANKYLLEHELEHAVEKHATDEGPNGLRHKKFFKEFLPRFFFPPLEVIQPTTEIGSGLNQAFGGSGGKPAKNAKAKAEQEQQQLQQSLFGGLGFGSPGLSQSPLSGSPVSPYSNQTGTTGSLNQGLNQQTVNPLDPYAQYGQQSGRIYNF